MIGHALFIRHTTRPGMRDDVARVWQKHMAPAIAANPGHLAYFYCFGADPDTICAFQHYASKDAASTFLDSPHYAAYLQDVTPLLLGEPDVQILDVQWIKGDARPFGND